jgi:2'-5' RNA ligase
MIENGNNFCINPIIFIAIPISEQLQMFESLQKYFARMLNPKIDPARCVPSQDLHVTIAYIGQVETTYVNEIVKVVKKAMKDFSMLQKPVRLLWQGEVSLYNNAIALTFAYDEGLILLAKMVRKELAEASVYFDDRFPFRAHATIARIRPNNIIKKKSVKHNILEMIKQTTTHELHPILVKQIGVYESGQTIPFKIFNCT